MPASLLSKHITAQSRHSQWARDMTATQSPKRRWVPVLTAQHEVVTVRSVPQAGVAVAVFRSALTRTRRCFFVSSTRATFYGSIMKNVLFAHDYLPGRPRTTDWLTSEYPEVPDHANSVGPEP